MLILIVGLAAVPQLKQVPLLPPNTVVVDITACQCAVRNGGGGCYEMDIRFV